MKPRRVLVTLEIETDWPVKDLRGMYLEANAAGTVHQVQINVMQGVKAPKKTKGSGKKVR